MLVPNANRNQLKRLVVVRAALRFLSVPSHGFICFSLDMLREVGCWSI